MLRKRYDRINLSEVEEKNAVDKGGEIVIHFSKNDDDNYLLIIGDNGVGVPESFDFKSAKSLGISLVHTLVYRQLKGEIEIDRSCGTEFKIIF